MWNISPAASATPIGTSTRNEKDVGKRFLSLLHLHNINMGIDCNLTNYTFRRKP